MLIQCPFSIFQPGAPANIDTRLTDNSQDLLVNALRTIRLNPNDLPVRPGFGTDGRPIKLRANFFPIKVRSSTYYEYDVALSPVAGTAIRRVKRRIFQLAEQSSDWERFGLKNTVAHDHSAKLISPKALPQPLSIRIPFHDEDEQPKAGGKEYTLTISFIQTNDLSALLRYFRNIAHLTETERLILYSSGYLQGDRQYRDFDIMPIISLFNVILAAHPNRSDGGGVLVGRNRFFFRSAMEPVSLGGGLEAWKGFYSSVRPTHNQLMVNVNGMVLFELSDIAYP